MLIHLGQATNRDRTRVRNGISVPKKVFLLKATIIQPLSFFYHSKRPIFCSQHGEVQRRTKLKFLKGVTCGFSNRSESGEKAEHSQRNGARNARAMPGLNSYKLRSATKGPSIQCLKKDLKDFACVKDWGTCGAVGRADGRIFIEFFHWL